MARRRHYRGLVRFPGLGRLSVPKSVKPTDVALGIGAGLGGTVAIKKGFELAGVAAPAILSHPLVGALASTAVVYVGAKKLSPARAGGLAVGAALGGLAVWAYGMLQSSGMLGDLRTLPVGYGAPIFDNPRQRLMGFNGPIFDNPNTNLMGIARMQGLGDENEDGMFPAP